jgi:hypothetical protein
MDESLNHRPDQMEDGERALLLPAPPPVSLSSSLAALEQYSVLLGANKKHISNNLPEYVAEIKRESKT